MSDRQLQVVLICMAFVAAATVLALARRWMRPNDGGPGIWKKYPTFLLLNILFLTGAWLPQASHGLAWLLVLIGAGASWELSRALGLTRVEQLGFPSATAGLILAAEWLSSASFLMITLAVVLAAAAASALTGPREFFGRRLVGVTACIIFLPVCLAAFLWLWHSDEGGYLAVFFYLAVCSNDAFAQITGQLVGRRMLAPHISPAKTVEGAAGGMLFTAALGAALCWMVGWSYIHGALMGIVISLAGTVGDLVESSGKRALGLKDFSSLLGAQGGVLDRFDTLIFAAPIFFLICSLST